MTDPQPWSRRQVLAGLAGGAALAAGGVNGLGGLLVAERAASASAALDGALLTGGARVDLDAPLGALGPRSMGFSFERRTLGTPLFEADNAAVVALFGLLGPGVLRLGGNSVEKSPWNPIGAGGSGAEVAPPDLVRLRGFLDAVDWNVSYGTPFLTGTADTVADEAAVVADVLGPRLVGLELCNEPDIYQLTPASAAIAGTFPMFLARWQTFAAAVRAAVPGIVMYGPADCLLGTLGGWMKKFLAAEGDGLGLVTQHYYRGFGFGSQTIEVLLAPDPVFDAALGTLATASSAHGIGYRLGETNSFANGGQAGVSNTQASALWGVDLLARAADGGAEGVNLHNSGSGAGYPAFVQINGVVTEIRPLFAGLLLGAKLGTGTTVTTSTDSGLEALRVHAVRRDDETVAVLVVNTDAVTDVALTVELGVAVASARVSALTGPGLAATAGVVVRGAPVDIDGTWDPEPPSPIAASGSQVEVTVLASSAVVVEVSLVPPTPPTTASTTPTSTPPTTPITNPPTSTSSTTSPSTSTNPITSTGSSGGSLASPATPVGADPTLAG